ncbi:MAG: DUF177 domain-containing protein [Armatimonadota bacterium]|nr:DUF177 domain-containing protein [bacterium]
MKLDLSEIALNLGKRISYEIDEPPIEDPEMGIRCTKPITGKVTFTNAGRHIVMRGRINTTIEVECARCLGPYLIELKDLPLEEELPLVGHVPEIIEDEEVLEDENEPLFVENILDFTELLRQTIEVTVPIKALCSEECKGLCPHCGKDLNTGPCGCPPDTETTAFGELASLLKEDEQQSEG